MLLTRWNYLYMRDIYNIIQFPETYQPIGVLCVMGEHPLQCRNVDI